MIKAVIHKSLRTLGLDLVRYRPQPEEYPPDFCSGDIRIIREVEPWTMTSPPRESTLSSRRCATTVPMPSPVPLSNVESGRVAACPPSQGLWFSCTTPVATHICLTRFRACPSPRRATSIIQANSHPARCTRIHGSSALGRLSRAVEKVLHDTSYPTSKIHFVAGDVDKTIPTGCTGFDFSLAA